MGARIHQIEAAAMMMRPDHAYFLMMMVSVAIAAYGMSVVIKILKYALAQGVI